MPVTSCSGTNTKSNFSGHVIIATIITVGYLMEKGHDLVQAIALATKWGRPGD